MCNSIYCVILTIASIHVRYQRKLDGRPSSNMPSAIDFWTSDYYWPHLVSSWPWHL